MAGFVDPMLSSVNTEIHSNVGGHCISQSGFRYGTTRSWINTLRPRQDGRYFPDDIFKWIFSNENVWISINISVKFVPKGPVDNIPALGQIMAWRRPGDKPLSQPMMVSLPTHICVTRPQWVNSVGPGSSEWHFRQVIFNLIWPNDAWGISHEIALWWMSLDMLVTISQQWCR